MTRILVAEDSPTQAEELKLILESAGFEVDLAPDGNAALDRLADTPYDVVVSDVIMPGLTGYQLCEKIKADPNNHDLPVILLTTMGHPHDILSGLECGADNFITKPFDSEYLINRLNNILTNKALRKDRKVQVGIELSLLGRTVTISSGREQILDILISAFEELVRAGQRESEQRHAREVLEEAIAHVKGALDALDERVALLDADGRILVTNQAWSRDALVAGFELAGSAVGTPYVAACESLSKNGRALAAGIREILSGKRKRFDLECRCRDHWFDARVTGFTSASELRASVSFRDITKHKHMEEQLREDLRLTALQADISSATDVGETTRGTLQKIAEALVTQLDAALVRIWTVNEFDQVLELQASAGLYTHLNGAHGRIPVGKYKVGLIAQTREPVVMNQVVGDPRIHDQEWARRESLVSFAGYPLAVGNRLLGVLAVFSRQPIVEAFCRRFFSLLSNQIAMVLDRRLAAETMQKLQEQLAASQKLEAIGRLAGGVAHDFNNILTGIIGYAQFLERQALVETAKSDVQMIRQLADRAAGLTQQLLAFSRKQSIRPAVLNLNDVVANVMPMFERLIGEHIHVRLELAPDVDNVEVDPTQIEQILMNLVVNAGDAMPTGGTLTIETRNVILDQTYARSHVAVSPGPRVLLSVSDTGCGMDRETLEHIFEPFFTTKEKGKGTGLGLATVYGAVKQHGGSIWVYSEPGKGTVFKLYFPTVKAPVSPRPSDSGIQPSGTGSQPSVQRGTETILLVEDNEAVRETTERLLREAGYRVIATDQPEQAETLMRRHDGRIDLLLTDVVMPEINGPELYTRLQRVRPDLKVVFMSGYTEDHAVLRDISRSATFFIEKPFDYTTLLAVIRKALDQSE